MRQKKVHTLLAAAVFSAAMAGTPCSPAKAEEVVTAETEPVTEAPLAETAEEPGTEVPAMEFETEVPDTWNETEPVTETRDTEPVTETATEPVTEPGTEIPDTEPSTEPANEPETEMPGTEPMTEPDTETPDSESESESEPESGTESESETETETETETEIGTEESQTESETKENPKKDDKEKKDKKQEKETEETESETESESETEEVLTNEELTARQNLVIPPKLETSFRFVTVNKIYAIASGKVRIYEAKSSASVAAGVLKKGGLCYILQEEGEWCYVESGLVRGFVRTEQLILGEEAKAYVAEHEERNLPLARTLVDPSENPALSYTKTTVRSMVVARDYAIAEENPTTIWEAMDENARTAGVLESGGVCYVLEDVDAEWAYVESGDVRGFAKQEALLRGEDAKKQVEDTGEAHMAKASERLSPSENQACYYRLISVTEHSAREDLQVSIVNYALQFAGNPYVWGGISLTDGADCSGFVQSVYAAFGYALPRVADAQSQCGLQIPISEAEPGDLIFYAHKGAVDHVSMYIGNGQVIEAANSNAGIVISGIDGSAVWAVRVI